MPRKAVALGSYASTARRRRGQGRTLRSNYDGRADDGNAYVTARLSRLILAVLALFIVINFWDRAALGLAADAIMRDLRLSHEQFGLLGGAFFILFPLSALAIGPLVDRYPSRWIIAAMALVWTLAQIAMSLAFALPAAIASRVLLGAGEGPAFPNALHAAYCGSPADRRPTVTALIGLGAPLGIASGAVIIPFAAAALGWRTTFVLLGLAGLVWTVAWLRLPRIPLAGEPSPKPLYSVPFNATAFGVIVAAFAVYWTLALSVTWFPASLEAIAGLSPIRAGEVVALCWALQALALPIAARSCESLVRRGLRSELSLALPATAGVCLSGIALIGLALFRGAGAAVALVALCLCAVALSVTCLPPIVAEVTRARERATALGLFAALSSTAGIAAPIVFGRIVDAVPLRDPGYRAALAASGFLLLAAACVAAVLMKPSRHRVSETPFAASPTR